MVAVSMFQQLLSPALGRPSTWLRPRDSHADFLSGDPVVVKPRALLTASLREGKTPELQPPGPQAIGPKSHPSWGLSSTRSLVWGSHSPMTLSPPVFSAYML